MANDTREIKDQGFAKFLEEQEAKKAKKGGNAQPQQAVIASSQASRPSGTGDPNIKRYLAEIANTPHSLLNLAREDTGEQGEERGGVVYFHADPIAVGHKDSFRVYKNADGTESWCCYSDSNKEWYKGGGLLEYLKSAPSRRMSERDAVRYLLDATGHQPRPKMSEEEANERLKAAIEGLPPESPGTGAAASDNEGPGGQRTSPWEFGGAAEPPKLPQSLIHGVLRRGHVGLLVAKAKTGKTFLMMQLAAAVATGTPWLGFQCERGKVLFIDPEIDRACHLNRLHKVVSEVDEGRLPSVDENVAHWYTEGVSVGDKPITIKDVAKYLNIQRDEGQLPDFSLIIIDSSSALLTGDENNSLDVRAFFNYGIQIAKATGAAVFLSHHEGKALSGDREAHDRARGSSAWGDCAATLLSLVQTFPPSGKTDEYLKDGQKGFMLECGLMRHFRAFEPKRLIWEYPLFLEDFGEKTKDWKPMDKAHLNSVRGGEASGETRRTQAQIRAQQVEGLLASHLHLKALEGGSEPPSFTAKEAVELLESGGVKTTTTTLKKYVEESDALRVIKVNERRWNVGLSEDEGEVHHDEREAEAPGPGQAAIAITDE